MQNDFKFHGLLIFRIFVIPFFFSFFFSCAFISLSLLIKVCKALEMAFKVKIFFRNPMQFLVCK